MEQYEVDAKSENELYEQLTINSISMSNAYVAQSLFHVIGGD